MERFGQQLSVTELKLSRAPLGDSEGWSLYTCMWSMCTVREKRVTREAGWRPR